MNVQRLLMDNDLIYIDTASLMNTSNLRNFLSNYEEEFAKSQNMIIVPEAVCQELIRHINSGNEEKSAKAIKALNIIREYNSIFTLEQSNFSPEEIQHAFADQELLVRLAKERRYKKQLLITNDRSLSKDAFDLNLLQSCRGKEISVCYMNYYGQLNPSKFESESVSDMDSTPVTPLPAQETLSTKKDVSSDTNSSILGYLGVALGAFALGFGTSRYGKSIMTNVKSLL